MNKAIKASLCNKTNKDFNSLKIFDGTYSVIKQYKQSY